MASGIEAPKATQLDQFEDGKAEIDVRQVGTPAVVEVFDIPRGDPRIEKQLATMVFGCY